MGHDRANTLAIYRVLLILIRCDLLSYAKRATHTAPFRSLHSAARNHRSAIGARCAVHRLPTQHRGAGANAIVWFGQPIALRLSSPRFY